MTYARWLFTSCCILFLISSASLAQSPPRNLHGELHNSSIELGWDHPESGDPMFYSVYRSVGNAPFEGIAFIKDQQFFDDNPSQNTMYRYRVTATFADSIESVPSNTIEIFTHVPDGIAPPRELEAHWNDPVVNLRWQHPHSDLTPASYNVYRGGSDFHDIKFLGSTSDTVFDDGSIELHRYYRYGVTAVYFDSVESFPSNIAQVFTSSQDSLPDSNVVYIRFVSEPHHFALVNQLYQYDADVETKPDGVPVTFSLGVAPDGMTINDSTGLVEWTPAANGVFEVRIVAHPRDGRLGGDEQEFHLFVLSGRPGSVEGVIRNAEGQGLPDVYVKLYDVSFGQFVLRAETDDTGHYRFPFVNPATYLIRARPGNDLYLPQWYSGASEIANATPVTVPETTNVTADFVLQRRDTTRFILSGTVMDDSSHPLGGAHVAVFRAEHDSLWGDLYDENWHHDRDPVHETETDENGNYSFRLRQGTYLVVAKAEGFLPQFWDHKATPLEADRISLTQNTAGINFNLHLRPEGKGIIAGTIHDGADSSGLESHVLAFQKDAGGHFTGFVAFTRSDSIGEYALENLPDGCYIVLAKDGDDFVPTFYNTTGGTTFFDSAACVEVSGNAVAGIDVYMRPDSMDGLNSVAGQAVESSSGSAARPESIVPVPGALVTIVGASNNLIVSSATTGQNGNYVAEGLSPGSYTVVFQKAGMSTVSVPISVSYSNNAPTTTLASAQMADDNGSGPMGTMNVRSHWNMISLPVTVADPHRSAVFPTASSNAFRFSDGAGYVAADLMNYAEGYWLNFSSAQALALQGTERTFQVIPVNEGWNMIGSLSAPIPVSSMQLSQPNLLSSSVFGYNGSYSFANTLVPGKGYWAKAAGSGTITLSSAAAVSKSSSTPAPDLTRLNTLTIRDASGNAQTLYFGGADAGVDLRKTELPPAGPQDAFDVRFASQRLAELHADQLNQTLSFGIRMQSAQAPLTVSWNIKNRNFHYALVDERGNRLTSSYLGGTGSIRLENSGTFRVALNVEPDGLPKQVALMQNYPNPFNPATNIQYTLPGSQLVTLKIFNILGQEVRTLVNEVQDGGYKSVVFDAGSLPSGVYMYRLMTRQPDGGSAGVFVSVKKLLLLK